MLGVIKYMKKNLILVFLIVILAVGIMIETYFLVRANNNLVKANNNIDLLLQYGEFDNTISVFVRDNLTDMEIKQVENEMLQIEGVNTVEYDARFDMYKVKLVDLESKNAVQEKISKLKNVKKVELSKFLQMEI